MSAILVNEIYNDPYTNTIEVTKYLRKKSKQKIFHGFQQCRDIILPSLSGRSVSKEKGVSDNWQTKTESWMASGKQMM